MVDGEIQCEPRDPRTAAITLQFNNSPGLGDFPSMISGFHTGLRVTVTMTTSDAKH